MRIAIYYLVVPIGFSNSQMVKAKKRKYWYIYLVPCDGKSVNVYLILLIADINSCDTIGLSLMHETDET